jgi:hypothetical protein
MRHIWILVAALIAMGSLIAGCGSSRRTTTAVVINQEPVRTSPRVVPGPPPHAPAHGYRYHHRDCELVYDSGLELYVVVGRSDRYYQDGRFYRHRGHRWFTSERVNGPWKVANKGSLPHGILAMKNGKPGKGKGARVN